MHLVSHTHTFSHLPKICVRPHMSSYNGTPRAGVCAANPNDMSNNLEINCFAGNKSVLPAAPLVRNAPPAADVWDVMNTHKELASDPSTLHRFQTEHFAQAFPQYIGVLTLRRNLLDQVHSTMGTRFGGQTEEQRRISEMYGMRYPTDRGRAFDDDLFRDSVYYTDQADLWSAMQSLPDRSENSLTRGEFWDRNMH